MNDSSAAGAAALGLLPGSGHVLALLALGLLIAASVVAWLGVRHANSRRNVEAFDTQSGDTISPTPGDGVHLTVGASQLGGSQTLAIFAGLLALRPTVRGAKSRGLAAKFTTGDPLTYFLAEPLLGVHPELTALDPTAYVATVTDVVETERPASNVMFGPLDDLYVMPMLAAHRKATTEVVGTTQLAGMPFAASVADRSAIGEEVSAVGALAEDDSLLATADWCRFGLLFAVIAVIAGRLLGFV